MSTINIFGSAGLIGQKTLNIINNIVKTKCENSIKFNSGNEFAVDLFSKNIINYKQIIDIIEKSLSINVDFKINNIQNILIYKKMFINKLKSKLNLYYTI